MDITFILATQCNDDLISQMIAIYRPFVEPPRDSVASAEPGGWHPWFTSFEEAAPSLAEMKKRIDDTFRNGFVWIVAVHDNPSRLNNAGGEQEITNTQHKNSRTSFKPTVVGYAYAGSFRSRDAYRPTVEAAVYTFQSGIHDVFVPASAQQTDDNGEQSQVSSLADERNTVPLRSLRGLGRALYDILSDILARAGFDQIIAVCASPSSARHLSPAVKAHLALGFEQVGFIPDVAEKMKTKLSIAMLRKKLVAPQSDNTNTNNNNGVDDQDKESCACYNASRMRYPKCDFTTGFIPKVIRFEFR